MYIQSIGIVPRMDPRPLHTLADAEISELIFGCPESDAGRHFMTAKFWIAGVAVAASMMAQPPQGPRGFGPGMGRGPGGPGGPPPNEVVTGAPYSGVEVRSNQQVLANGTVIQHEDSTKVARDSQGRTRRETTRTAPDGTTQTRISISDPVAGKVYELDPATKTAFARPAHFPNQQQQQNGTQTGTQRGTAGMTRGPRGGQPGQPNANIQRETLAAQTINGVIASGSRVTHTIPAGQIGNSAAIQTVHETWMADDLKVPVRSKMTDPRTGTNTMELTNLMRGEPDASMFSVPSDYTVKQGPGGPGGRGRGPGGPPPVRK